MLGSLVIQFLRTAMPKKYHSPRRVIKRETRRIRLQKSEEKQTLPPSSKALILWEIFKSLSKKIMKLVKSILLAATLTATIIACNDNGVMDPNATNDVMIEFENVVGDRTLVLDDATYKNANGDDFTVSTFNYYVSNIQLKKTDGTVVTVPRNESYFLVEEDKPASKLVTLKGIPSGDYNEILFVIGVDSLKSVSPVEERIGALAESNGMYWRWNSGYIFVKMEGSSPQAPADPAGKTIYRFHIGGFGGYDSPTVNNIKSTRLPFMMPAQVRADKSPTVHLIVDALKLMNGSTNVRISENATTMGGPFAPKIAANYENMFSVDHVHN